MGAIIPELPRMTVELSAVCSYCRRPFEGDATCRGCGAACKVAAGAVCKVTKGPTRPPLPPPVGTVVF